MLPKKTVKVLIVGEDPQIAAIVAEKRTLLNHESVKVSNGEEALLVASKQPPFDFLFTDIKTPEINGADFAKQFNELYPRTNVVYMIL